MQLLDYLRLAAEYEKTGWKDAGASLRLAIVTNFTDDLLKKTLTGLCVSEGIHPAIYQVPFKQYLFQLKDPHSALVKHEAEITFVFFDVNPYISSEFLADADHREDVWNDLVNYCRTTKGAVVLHTFITPSGVQHGRVLRDSDLHELADDFNARIKGIAEEFPHVSVIETDRLIRKFGEHHARDLRGLYAFSQPFSGEFHLAVAKEWMTYVRAISGKTRKCLVLDLDNTLWGGVVGETGPLGISLGTEYPGNAFRQFQRVILELHKRGIILAINSRNNAADVKEVFEKNPHMILQEEHFSAIAVNWNTKAENLTAIAQELNIGLDSMVFIDDDPMNRELVRTQLPEVLVPEWSFPPEEYTKHLLDLDAFHAQALTDEDRERGRMYQEERARKAVRVDTQSLEEYLATLGIEIDLYLNPDHLIPRLAQLTQKTNQFNLTTKRSSEAEIGEWIGKDALIFAGDVRDKFGPYGVTILAVLHPIGQNTVTLGIFLMSCRVMGRGVEKAFFRKMAEELNARGYTDIRAAFIPSDKNAPAADFLPDIGAIPVTQGDTDAISYKVDIPAYLSRSEAKVLPITINFSPL